MHCVTDCALFWAMSFASRMVQYMRKIICKQIVFFFITTAHDFILLQVECKRAEPKDASSAPSLGQALIDPATAGAMVLAQGPDGSVSLVPAHAFAAATQGHGAALVYPQSAAAGVGLMSPVDIAAYRAAAAGVSAELLQAGAMQQGENYLMILCITA